jgi:hypothetical protein
MAKCRKPGRRVADGLYRATASSPSSSTSIPCQQRQLVKPKACPTTGARAHRLDEGIRPKVQHHVAFVTWLGDDLAEEMRDVSAAAGVSVLDLHSTQYHSMHCSLHNIHIS